MKNTMNQLGMDHTGAWTPAQYAIDAGWSLECVEATARHGIADEDAEELTVDQQSALLEFCRARVARIEEGKILRAKSLTYDSAVDALYADGEWIGNAATLTRETMLKLTDESWHGDSDETLFDALVSLHN